MKVFSLTLIAGLAGLSAMASAQKPTYENVQKILNARCIGCHSQNGKEGVDLRTFASIMKGGEHGPIVKPKDLKGSALANVLRGTNGMKIMPPRSKGIPAAEIKLIEAWILNGAKEK